VTQLLTTQEACVELRCCRRTVVRYISRGLLSPIRVNQRRNLFRSDEIDVLVQRQINSDAVVIRSALVLLAEHQAEDKRPSCKKCGVRRVRPGSELCTPCHEAEDLQLAHKRKWWDDNGVDAKARVRAKKAAASA
jgi:hypothetical protein